MSTWEGGVEILGAFKKLRISGKKRAKSWKRGYLNLSRESLKTEEWKLLMSCFRKTTWENERNCENPGKRSDVHTNLRKNRPKGKASQGR